MPVRKRMTRQLRENLTKLVGAIDPSIKVKHDWEKVEVFSANDEYRDAVATVLSQTPGIAKFSQVVNFPLGCCDDSCFDDILTHVKAVWGDRLSNKYFAVRVKRSGQHSFASTDVERMVGGGLLAQTGAAGVKLKKPDITVGLEIRKDQLFILEDTQQGLGGFPLGTQDAVLSLISGGFDSTVASYLSIRRGLKTHFLFFNLGGRAHEIGVKEVSHYIWQKYGSSHWVQFITVPFEPVVAEILTKVNNAEMGVVLKRMMLRAASQIAKEMGVDALVTGESVAQVSSQTLANLSIIDSVIDTLVIRPLVTSDKESIIDTARQIGTEQFAANMPEYCGVISVKPTTRAKQYKVQEQEANFDFSVLVSAIENKRCQPIATVMDDSLSSQIAVETFAIPQPGSVILDIRHPDEVEAQPLSVPGAEVDVMPFFKVQNGFNDLDASKTYLLYCDRGVMSQLHAELLIEGGATNVAVYRPEYSG